MRVRKRGSTMPKTCDLGILMAADATLSDKRSFWYLATPYSKYPGGIEDAFRAACRFTGKLIERGIPVYSPIAHTHPVAIHSKMDPFDHSIWLPADEPMMRAAHGLIVMTMEGWDTSKGIAHEIAEFGSSGKVIVYLEPSELDHESA